MIMMTNRLLIQFIPTNFVSIEKLTTKILYFFQFIQPVPTKGIGTAGIVLQS